MDRDRHRRHAQGQAGSGTPLKKIRHPFATEAEATRAAEAALQGAERAAMEITCALTGFEPGLLGGDTVQLAGLEPGT
ncbi:hypothetical protein [Paracoccus sp. MKU1]|uniref:hypothetical protein n=1 Tax=Paracoccus sp. MKU1 TaxID=1745182 RepID=UPI001EEFEB15|nr:hypothetical protein [Paracoccus sp. MKU1]